ncbi:uncharacterized protein LOC115743774 isoform X2 [Rhodamnia argentea]|uniref:Uncharacterized protein LOC115743774 isoform X2 n=1 Tax=Rhodamnia argentea TaxID=178133 RepID=A0ABM3HD18_9MYRT|nr:uncharacterized protein LOC115743774 isoform X2 [Rhodamnia argentea]
MASLGFRHPQFSEDLAWLPDWLQQSQSEYPVAQPLESAALSRENVGEDKRLELSSKDGGGYTGCRLFLSGEDGSPFLSGEDGSPTSYAQSPGKVLHFHLRFSYNSGSQSQCTKSQESNASLAGLQSSKGAQIQRVEIASQPVEKVRARVYGENLRRHLKDADVNAAVELSIAASEAMAIHELVECESALKSIPAAAVVEVALRVKEARLKGSEEVSDSVIKRTEEDLDFDDIAMLDAFEDVGLSSIDYNEQGISDFDISQVKETPSSQIPCDNGSPTEETRIDFNKMNAQSHAHDVLGLDKQPESESLLGYSPYECRKSTFGDKDWGSPNFNVASHVDMLHQPALKESFVLTVEKVGSDMVENALCERQAESFVHNISQCPVEYRQVYLTEERFQSRWLGGWATKDIEVPVELKEKSTRTRSIAKFFVHETSFLSESADTAPDENSVVQIGISTQKAPQLKMAFEGSCDEVNEGITFSQEIVRSSSLLSADPLCSFVPCSISTENHGLHQEPSQNCIEIDGEKFIDLASELGSANPNETSDPKSKADNQNAGVTSEPKEGFQKSARRRLSSLKNYSVILSSNEAKLENGHGRCNLLLFSKCKREITSSYPDTNFTQKYNWRNSVGLKSPKSGYDIPAMVCGEEPVPVTKHPAEKVAFHRSISVQPAKNAAALQVHLLGKRKLLLLSDDKKWRHNMDSHRLAGDCLQKIPLNAANIRQDKNNHVSGRKRVSFSSEVHLQLQVDKSTRGSLHQNCSTTGSWKRLRYCKSQLECRRQGAKHRTSFMAEQPLIFHKMEFFLTGFSTRKEKEIERLIQKHGGEVLLDIPPVNLRGKGSSMVLSEQRPFVISPRKLKTAKFLYGCAIRAFILKVAWITESISAGSLVLPDKYMIVSNQVDAMFIPIGKSLPHSNSGSIFGQVGIMLHGKKSFCNKFSEVIKRGGGVAYKTLQQLVHCLHHGKVSMGIIVTEYESRPSRHLRQCALERKIPILLLMQTMSWIIESLYAGKMLSVLEQHQNLGFWR